MKNSEPNQNGKGPGIEKEKGRDLYTEGETKPNKDGKTRIGKFLRVDSSVGPKRADFEVEKFEVEVEVEVKAEAEVVEEVKVVEVVEVVENVEEVEEV